MANDGAAVSKLPDWAGKRGEQWQAQLVGMEAMLARIENPLLDALVLDAPYRIADVGCGGGGTTFSILRRAPVGSVVHGFDVSPALIQTARARAAADPSAIRFEVCDMGSAAPPDGKYDRLVSRNGIMFFADPPAAFRNLAGWLAPGGRFAFAVWSPPADNPWLTLVREIVGSIVEVPPLESAGPGLFRYAEVETLLALLREAGFGELDVRPWRGMVSFGVARSAEDAATFALEAFGSFKEQLAAAGEGAFARAHGELTARLAPHRSEEGVRMSAGLHIVTGRA